MDFCRSFDAELGRENATDEKPLVTKVMPTALPPLTQEVTYFELPAVENKNNSQKCHARE